MKTFLEIFFVLSIFAAVFHLVKNWPKDSEWPDDNQDW